MQSETTKFILEQQTKIEDISGKLEKLNKEISKNLENLNVLTQGKPVNQEDRVLQRLIFRKIDRFADKHEQSYTALEEELENVENTMKKVTLTSSMKISDLNMIGQQLNNVLNGAKKLLDECKKKNGKINDIIDNVKNDITGIKSDLVKLIESKLSNIKGSVMSDLTSRQMDFNRSTSSIYESFQRRIMDVSSNLYSECAKINERIRLLEERISTISQQINLMNRPMANMRNPFSK